MLSFTPTCLFLSFLAASQSLAQHTLAPPGRHRHPRSFLFPNGFVERQLSMASTTTVAVSMEATRTVWDDTTDQAVLGDHGRNTNESGSSSIGPSEISKSMMLSPPGVSVTYATDASDPTRTWSEELSPTSSYISQPTHLSPSSTSPGDLVPHSSSVVALAASPFSEDGKLSSADYTSSQLPATGRLSDGLASTPASTWRDSLSSLPFDSQSETRVSSSVSSIAIDSAAILEVTSSIEAFSVSATASAKSPIASLSQPTALISADHSELGPPAASKNISNTVANTAGTEPPSEPALASDSPSSASAIHSVFASTTSDNVSVSQTKSAVDSSFETSSASSTLSASDSSNTTSLPTFSSSPVNAILGPALMLGYYPDWSVDHLFPEDIDWSRFDMINFAFAIPNLDGSIYFLQDNSEDILRRLVAAAHSAGKRVSLSIGGWTGSAYFSAIVANDSVRLTFVSNILDMYNQYHLDGIDIDWEYPGTLGAEGNIVSGNDSANYLIFLQDLRATLPEGAIITTAAQVWPFADSNGSPMSDVTEFSKVLDWILIMNYDVWGSSSSPGPNAPLSDGCSNATQPLVNAYAAVSSWTSAGMPANQITLGVPAYGYLQQSNATSLLQRRHLPVRSHRRAFRSKRADVNVVNASGGTTDGQVMWHSLIDQGVLTLQDEGYTGAGGFTRYWDECSSTPWLKSESSGQIITYDDPQSMNLKGQLAAQAGLRGCNIFSIDGDYTGYSWPLTDAVRSGMGI
ncbi:uncharacterized protein L203_101645 [Cryptococcus depauperatus CBS 7841]|uniref:Uncharacterized protein n=1 Tax=Cryptococcus depauperatus CBS 7841 TaxID=1295531 RepID=A0A1E3ITG9_9TREE|nr:hypothetical protein L203_00986 [Cryptococcus depauperatus CBS 7841]